MNKIGIKLTGLDKSLKEIEKIKKAAKSQLNRKRLIKTVKSDIIGDIKNGETNE